MFQRICFFIIVFLGLNYFAWAQIALPVFTGQPAKTSLVLDYDFSKASTYSGSGTAVNDLINNSASTLYNAPTFASGGNALVFSSASSQYLMTNTDLGNKFSGTVGAKHNNVSLVLWVYPTASNGVILSEQGINSLNANWHDSQIEIVGGVMKFRFWNMASISSSISTALNTWYLVALTYDGRFMKAYINGQLAGIVDDAGRLAPYNFANTYSLYYCIACADATHLGSGAYGSFRLGRFRVYTTPLVAAELSTIYNSEKSNYPNAILYLDAGQTASYSGTGTTWSDISGKGNNSTLYNITYQSTVGGGSMFFSNAVNRYASFTAPVTSATTITAEMWVKTTSLNDGMYFGFNMYDIWTSGGGIGFNTAASDLYGISAAQVSTLGIIGNWKHLVFVMNTDSYLGNKIYVNGVLQSLSQIASSQSSGNANFNSGLGLLGGWYANANFRSVNMNLATFKIYDKEISAGDILSKYNAEKSRYGL